MCGCGCELAMILATARQEADASAAVTSGRSPGAPPCPDLFELAGRALVNAIDWIAMSVVERLSGRGAVR